MAFADILAWIGAGLAGLIWAHWIGNASWPDRDQLFTLSSRDRLIDFAASSLAWVIWFHFIKNRYLRPIPFWAEVLEYTQAALFSAMINLAVIALARNDYSRSILFLGWFTLLFTLPATRSICRWGLMRLKIWSRPTWIIGAGDNAKEARYAIESEWQMGFDFQGNIDPRILQNALLSGGIHPALNKPERSTFVIALDEGDPLDIAPLIQDLTLLGVRSIDMVPTLRGIPLYGAELNYFLSHEVLLLSIRNNLASRPSKMLKVGFDFLATLVMLIPAIPIIAFTAFLIWIEDGGPVFYVQNRLGREGREFGMIKMRTMRKDAEVTLLRWKKTNSPEWQQYLLNNFKLENDPRLLKVGKFLRRASIDELPQLFNVVMGQMSLVGPRPILARETEAYGKNLILYQTTRPGITGLWQISGRSKTSFEHRSILDAWYIRNWSLSYDLLILCKTVTVVLGGKGAH